MGLGSVAGEWSRSASCGGNGAIMVKYTPTRTYRIGVYMKNLFTKTDLIVIAIASALLVVAIVLYRCYCP